MGRLMPTMATEAMVDMVLATPLATVLATAMVVMARGLLTLRLMPTTAMEDMVGTVLATPLATVLATVMVVMARGLLTLKPMPTMAMEAMVDTDSVMAMATASKQLSNGSYPDLPRLMQGTATTNICHILNFKLKILELGLLN